MIASLFPVGTRPQSNYTDAPAVARTHSSEVTPPSSTPAPRFVLEVPGPTPTLYGIGAVIRLGIAELVEQLPGKWSSLALPKHRRLILDPLLRLLPSSKRQQISAVLEKNGAAAQLESLLGTEIVSFSAFAVWSGKDIHAAITSGNLGRLPSPMLFLNVKPPGAYSAMAATKLWGNGNHGLQLGGGIPTTVRIPGLAQPAIVMRNIYGGVTRKQDPNETPRVMLRANMLLGVLPPVPFSRESMGLISTGLRRAALAVDVAGVAGAVGGAVLSRGTSVKAGLTSLQLLLVRAASSALRAGGSVADRTTLFAGPAWSITATAPVDKISMLVRGELSGQDTVLRIAGKNFQPASWLGVITELLSNSAPLIKR
jgi:hypothetical protein